MRVVSIYSTSYSTYITVQFSSKWHHVDVARCHALDASFQPSLEIVLVPHYVTSCVVLMLLATSYGSSRSLAITWSSDGIKS